jgi:hypothetical protein
MSTASQEKARIQQLKELTDIVITGDCHYSIWWILSNREDRTKYHETLDDSPLFFRASIHAHFLATVVALYVLYETRRDTINLPRIVSEASETVKAKLSRKLTEAKNLWKKVAILRNECFAHVSSNLSIGAVFKKAGVRPNDLKRLVELSKEIVNDLSYAEDRSSHAFNLDPSSETRNILDQLKKNVRSS